MRGFSYLSLRWSHGFVASVVSLVLIVAVGVLDVPDITLAAGSSRRAATPSTPGTIAYVNQGATELHLIQPDGTNDRVIWTEPASSNGLNNALLSPAWRPDSAEVAFVSSHEQTTSLYQTDVYGVAPDGSQFRRMTNPPDSSQLGGFPTATVDVTVANNNLSDSLFFVYVAGAPQMQSVVVSAGNTAVVTFSNVAVFQGKAQFAVAIDGNYRWIGDEAAQLSPGGTGTARVDIYAYGGQEYLGARSPVWRSDGQELDDDLGQGCVGEAWPESAPPGTTTTPLVNFSQGMCSMDRGPTTPSKNDILYWDNFDFSQGGDGTIDQTTEGATSGTMILDTGYSSYVYDLKYLPDDSGFLFSKKPVAIDEFSNLYRYDFSTQKVTQLTSFTNAFVNHFTISPDGQFVVFEHTTQDPISGDVPTDLWMMSVSGANAGLFVANAQFPAWSRGAVPIRNKKVFLPVIFH